MKDLPHIHAFKWYAWARKFFESKKKYNFLCAANQISKSSTMIRKAIHWATAIELWPELWESTPTQFWYFYPDLKVATREFEEKWVKEFLPKNELKDSDSFGWRAVYEAKKIDKLIFNSGVTIYFRSYEQKASALQSASVNAMFCDEEMPVDLYHELVMRLFATKGYFHMCFTATLGQTFWKNAIEEKGKYETFKKALKLQVSMHDCLEYEDGSKTKITKEVIEEAKEACGSQKEIDRRILGKFVLDENLVFPNFNRNDNITTDSRFPEDWHIFSGVDIGSGGKAHPSAIVFVAVNSQCTRGVVFSGWRGDGEKTTAQDVLEKYRVLRGNLKPYLECYDWASVDFKTLSDRQGESFIAADKNRDSGLGIVNALFSKGMLKIHAKHEDDELWKLVHELESVRIGTSKTQAKDDFCDALRYAITRIPWDYSAMTDRAERIQKEKYEAMTYRQRRVEGLSEKEAASYEEKEDPEKIAALQKKLEIEEYNKENGATPLEFEDILIEDEEDETSWAYEEILDNDGVWRPIWESAGFSSAYDLIENGEKDSEEDSEEEDSWVKKVKEYHGWPV